MNGNVLRAVRQLDAPFSPAHCLEASVREAGIFLYFQQKIRQRQRRSLALLFTLDSSL